MDFLLIFFIGIALSMDIFAVSIIISLTSRKQPKIKQLMVPLSFGIFHTVMIIFGYLLSMFMAGLIESYDHWIAFILLFFLGSKMIREGIVHKGSKCIDWTCMKNLITVSLATSMDALVLGITFSLLGQDLVSSSILIGMIVFVLSLIGILCGKKLKFLKPRYNNIVGGVVLISIGIRVLLEHIF